MGIERAKGVSVVPEVVEPPVDSPFVGTVFENPYRLHYGSFSNGGEYNSTSIGYFNTEFRFYGRTVEVNSGRKRIAIASGKGWLTSLLTPKPKYINSTVVVELIIDGKTHTKSFKMLDRDERIFFGLAKSNLGNSTIFHPTEVINKGLAVEFNSSLEVWINISGGADGSAARMRSGVHVLMAVEKL